MLTFCTSENQKQRLNSSKQLHPKLVSFLWLMIISNDWLMKALIWGFSFPGETPAAMQTNSGESLLRPTASSLCSVLLLPLLVLLLWKVQSGAQAVPGELKGWGTWVSGRRESVALKAKSLPSTTSRYWALMLSKTSIVMLKLWYNSRQVDTRKF